MSYSQDLVHQYLDAWNSHNTDRIVESFSEGGTYYDPTSKTLIGNAIGTYAKSLWTAFPDLNFQLISVSEQANAKVSFEWLMTGTNTASFMGLPPTGKTISLPGADFIEFDSDGITSLIGYFDTSVVPYQLGLQVIVQPASIGPFEFGTSVHVHSGNKTKPGAFAITFIDSLIDQIDEIRAFSRETATEMMNMEGFIGLDLSRVGGKGYTISAWEKPENIKQIMIANAHKAAMKRLLAEDGLGKSVYTSVWTPLYYNPLKVRCLACRKMVDYEKHAGTCSCGQVLPESPPYF